MQLYATDVPTYSRDELLINKVTSMIVFLEVLA